MLNYLLGVIIGYWFVISELPAKIKMSKALVKQTAGNKKILQVAYMDEHWTKETKD